jgi:hypothetical protein
MPLDHFSDACYPEPETEADMKRNRDSEALREAFLEYWRDEVEQHIKDLKAIAENIPNRFELGDDWDCIMDAILKLRELWPNPKGKVHGPNHPNR